MENEYFVENSIGQFLFNALGADTDWVVCYRAPGADVRCPLDWSRRRR